MKFLRRFLGILLLVLVIAVLAPSIYFNRQITPEVVQSQLITLNTLFDHEVDVKMVGFSRHLFSTDVKYEVSSKNFLDSDKIFLDDQKPVAEVTQTIEPGWLPLSRLARLELTPVLATSHFVIRSIKDIKATMTVDSLIHLDKTQNWVGRLADINNPDFTVKNLHFTYEGSGIYLRPNIKHIEDPNDAILVVKNQHQKVELAVDQWLIQNSSEPTEINKLRISSEQDSQLNQKVLDGQGVMNTSIGSFRTQIGSLTLSGKNFYNTLSTDVAKIDTQQLKALRSGNPIQLLAWLMRTNLHVQLDTTMDQLNVEVKDQAQLTFNKVQQGIDYVQGQPHTPKLSNTFLAKEYLISTPSLAKPRTFHSLHLDWFALLDDFQPPIQLTLKELSIRNTQDQPLVVLSNGHALLNTRLDFMEGSVEVENHMNNALMYLKDAADDTAALTSSKVEDASVASAAQGDDKADLTQLMSVLHLDEIVSDPQEKQDLLNAIQSFSTHFMLSMKNGETYLNWKPISKTDTSYLMLMGLFWNSVLLPDRHL